MPRPKTRTPEEIAAYRAEYKRRRRIAQQTAPGYLNRSERQRGEHNHNAKLNPKLVRSMRRQHEQGKPIREIAADVGVAYSTAYAAIKGQTWS